jgi:hypothetical protein
MTDCDEPYIGDESIMRPPAAKKARITSAQASRAARSLPTLKVIQLPSPTSGTCSPLDGMARVATAPTGAGWPVAGRAQGRAGASMATAFSTVRRVVRARMKVLSQCRRCRVEWQPAEGWSRCSAIGSASRGRTPRR